MRPRHRFTAIIVLLALAGLLWWALRGDSAPTGAQPSGTDTAAAPADTRGGDGSGDRRRRVRLSPRNSGGGPGTEGDPDGDATGSARAEPAGTDAPPHESLPEGPAAIGELVGRVLRFPDRSPIEGAVVSLRGGGPGRHVAPYPEPARVTTGPNGIFRIAGFAPGTYSFEAALEGRAARRFRVAFMAQQAADEVDVLFGAGGNVVGRVETAAGPAEGVTVRINPSGIGGGRGLLSCTTGAGGEYRLEDLPPGPYGVEVDGGGARSRRSASVTVTAGETARIDFLSEASLVGVVRWDGDPLAGAIVRVTRTGSEYRSQQAMSGEDGAFRMDGLEPGEHRITVQVLTPPGFAIDVELATLTAGENRIDLLLGQGDVAAGISGRVSVAATGAAPPSRTQITLQAMTKEAERAWVPGSQVAMLFPDATGAFRVLGLRPGRYHIIVRSGGLQGARIDVALASGERKSGLEFRLEAREPRETPEEVPSVAVLSGVVTDAGRPLVGAYVRAFPDSDESRLRQTTTDGIGRYVLDRLDPGKWWVHVQVVGRGGFSAEVAAADIAEGTNRLDIRLDEGELAGQIRGRVTARVSGRALTSTDVVLSLIARGADGRGRNIGMTTPGASGSFRFRCVRGGRYRIVAYPRGGSLRKCEVDVDVVAGQALERVVVALEEMRSGAVRFVLRYEDGSPVRRASIRSMLDGEWRQGSVATDSASGVYETHFEVGVHEITLSDWADSVRAEVTVEVREGETAEVEAVLLPAEQ